MRRTEKTKTPAKKTAKAAKKAAAAKTAGKKAPVAKAARKKAPVAKAARKKAPVAKAAGKSPATKVAEAKKIKRSSAETEAKKVTTTPAREAASPVAVVVDGALVIKGYKVLLDAGLDYKIINTAGNVLASVPDAVRKSPEWQQLIALRENHRQRIKENTRTIEGWMLARRSMSTARLAPLFFDPAWAKPLGSLLVRSGDLQGFIVGGDAEKGLGLLNRELDTEWVKRDSWRIPHPLDLTDLTTWQQIAAENGLAQGVLQLMRPIYRAEGKEGGDKSTDRFSEREFSSTIQLSYAFGARGWAATRGTASRTFELLEGEEVLRLTAEFEYATNMEDYGDMNGECTTGGLSFFAVSAEGETDEDDDFGFSRYYRKDKALLLKQVPPSIFSEACFEVEAVLSSIRK